jgi:hypothetical protein
MFYRNCQVLEATLFTITLEEIDRELADRQVVGVPTEVTDEELIDRKLPPKHGDLTDVFLPKESNKLPLYRTIDHKIVLERENSLRFSPLYYMSTAEL